MHMQFPDCFWAMLPAGLVAAPVPLRTDKRPFLLFSKLARCPSACSRRESLVSDAYHQAVADHLGLQRTIFTVCGKAVYGHDILLGHFTLQLVAAIEGCMLKNDILVDLDKPVELAQNFFMLSSVFWCSVC